jgi:hypothetical protein
MVTFYLCSLYYYVSCNYRYDNIDKSQIIGFFGGLGTGDWGIEDWGAASLKKWTQKKCKEFILESEIAMGTPVGKRLTRVSATSFTST